MNGQEPLATRAITKHASRLQSIGRMFALTTAVGIALACWPLLTLASRCLLAVYLVSLLHTVGHLRLAVAAVLLAMYLPYLWLICDWQDFPWNSHRWHWIGMALQLPGLWAEIPFHPLSDFWFAIVTSLATLVGFCVLATLASNNRRAMWCVAGITFAISVVQSFISLAIYRT